MEIVLQIKAYTGAGAFSFTDRNAGAIEYFSSGTRGDATGRKSKINSLSHVTTMITSFESLPKRYRR